MPTVAAHLPEDAEVTRKFFSHVAEHYRKKPGPFIRELIDDFFVGSLDALQPAKDREILVTLARRILDPLEAEELAVALAEQRPAVDQRKVLQILLRGYLASLAQETSSLVAESDPAHDTARDLVASIARDFRQAPPSAPSPPPNVPPRKRTGRG